MEDNKMLVRESMPAIAKVLSVFGGTIASFCFIIAIVFSEIISEPSVALVLSVVAIGGLVFVSRVANHPFLETVVISIFIAALVLFCYGLFGLKINYRVVCVLVMAISVITFMVGRGWALKFISVLMFNGALLAWAFMSESLFLVNFTLIFYCVVLFLLGHFEGRMVKLINSDIRPLYFGFFISFLCGLALCAYRPYLLYSAGYDSENVGVNYVSELLLSGVIYAGLVYMVSRIMIVMKVGNSGAKVLVYLLMALFLVPAVFAPYLLGVIFVLLMSFYYGLKGEVIISVVALCCALSRYYYMLDTSLLVKSGVLVLTGVVLFGAWYFFNKKKVSDEKN